MVAAAMVAVLLGAQSWTAAEVTPANPAPPAAVAPEVAGAEALLSRGIELRRQRRDQEALQVFQQARALHPSPKSTAQIGLAEQALGRWAAAEADITAALAAATDAWIVRNRDALLSARQVVRTHLGSLSVLGSPAGALVRVNGAAAGTLPMQAAVFVPAGDALVSVEAPGYESTRRKLIVSAQSEMRETIDLVPNAPAVGQATGPVGQAAPAAVMRPTERELPRITSSQPAPPSSSLPRWRVATSAGLALWVNGAPSAASASFALEAGYAVLALQQGRTHLRLGLRGAVTPLADGTSTDWFTAVAIEARVERSIRNDRALLFGGLDAGPLIMSGLTPTSQVLRPEARASQVGTLYNVAVGLTAGIDVPVGRGWALVGNVRADASLQNRTWFKDAALVAVTFNAGAALRL